MTDKLNSQQAQKRSVMILRPACAEHAINPLVLVPMYGLDSWCEYREGMALNSHGRLYTCDSEVGASRSGLRVIHSSQAEADYAIWVTAQGASPALRSPAGLQTSLGCEGDGLTPPTNFQRHVLEGQKTLKQLSDAIMQGQTLRSVVTLRTHAQRALMALDNIADCPHDPVYFDTPYAWISWAKKRAQDQAAELRAALAAEIGAAEGSKS